MTDAAELRISSGEEEAEASGRGGDSSLSSRCDSSCLPHTSLTCQLTIGNLLSSLSSSPVPLNTYSDRLCKQAAAGPVRMKDADRTGDRDTGGNGTEDAVHGLSGFAVTRRIRVG